MMRLALTAFALTLAASAAQPLTPRLFSEIKVQGGIEQQLPSTDITIAVTKVEDGRCPAGVDCVWAGAFSVEVAVKTASSNEHITLCSGCENIGDLATAAGQTFGLIGLAPSTEELAKLGREPQLSDYTVTLNYAPAN